MSDAEHIADRFAVRQDQWPGSKFKPPKGAQIETDISLPGARFYRFKDGSVARLETGELTA